MKAYYYFMAGGVDKMVDKNSGRYLYRKRGVFYFSRYVPIDMRAHHGCSRIVVCLKTKSGDAAVKGSQTLAQKLDDYWLSLPHSTGSHSLCAGMCRKPSKSIVRCALYL